MVEVYRVPLYERYFASRFSVSWFSKLAYYIILIIVPIYVAYSSGSFYKTFDFYREQPNTRCERQFLMVGSGLSLDNNSPPATSSVSTPILWSTYPNFNSLFPSSSITQPLAVRVSFTDSNSDSIPDEWFGELEFPVNPLSPVTSVKLLMTFSATLSQKVDVEFSSLIPIVMETGLLSRGLEVSGDLVVSQINPLAYQASRTAFRASPIQNSDFQSIQDADVNWLIQKSQLYRNETLLLDNSRSVWRYTSAPGASSFIVKFRFRVPVSTIQFVPGAAEVMKFAFIQWLACLAIIWFFLSYIREFVFRNRILQAVAIKDSQPKIKSHQF